MPMALPTAFSLELSQHVGAFVRHAAAEFEQQVSTQIAREQEEAQRLREEVQRLRGDNANLLDLLQQGQTPSNDRNSNSKAAVLPAMEEQSGAPRKVLVATNLSGPPLEGAACCVDEVQDTVAVEIDDQDLSSGHKSLMDAVRQRFKSFDVRCCGSIRAEDVVRRSHRGTAWERRQLERAFRKAIEDLNYKQPDLTQKWRHPNELTLEGLKFIICTEHLEGIVSADAAHTFDQIRNEYIGESALALITESFQVDVNDVESGKTGMCSIFAEPVVLLETVSGAMIALNVLIMGIRIDVYPHWHGWELMELGIGMYLAVEVLLRVRLVTCGEFFFGNGCLWHYFDIALVILAMFDITMWIVRMYHIDSVHRHFIEVDARLTRILQSSRCLRVLRLIRVPLLKDLRVMVMGLCSGFQMLGWAFFILFVLIWGLGVGLYHVLAWEVHCPADDRLCKRAQAALEPQLFNLGGNTPRAMFTVFRCLTDGCAAADGTPLMVILWDIYGWHIIAAYVAVVVFVTFGVFNLIMALFVERTLATADNDNAKRTDQQYWENVQKARQLQEVVMKVCHGKQLTTQPSLKDRRISRIWGIINWLRCKGFPRQDQTAERKETSIDYTNLQVHIDRRDFEDVINIAEVSELLGTLDISVTNGGKLFEILDSDGSGWVDIAEVAEGLVKLRGPVDKGDIVSTALMVRHLQRTLHEIQRDQETLKDLIVPLQNTRAQSGTENSACHSRLPDPAPCVAHESF